MANASNRKRMGELSEGELVCLFHPPPVVLCGTIKSGAGEELLERKGPRGPRAKETSFFPTSYQKRPHRHSFKAITDLVKGKLPFRQARTLLYFQVGGDKVFAGPVGWG